MKIVWNGLDLVVLAVGIVGLLLIGLGLFVSYIKTFWKERKDRRANDGTDKA